MQTERIKKKFTLFLFRGAAYLQTVFKGSQKNDYIHLISKNMQKRVKCGIGDCPLFHIFLFLEFLQQRHQVADIGLREFRIADECVEKGFGRAAKQVVLHVLE